MGNLVKALKIAANVAEIIVAGSVLIELARCMVADWERKNPPRVKSKLWMRR